MPLTMPEGSCRVVLLSESAIVRSMISVSAFLPIGRVVFSRKVLNSARKQPRVLWPLPECPLFLWTSAPPKTSAQKHKWLSVLRLGARQALTPMTSACLARGLRRSEPINKGTLRSSASCVNAEEWGRGAARLSFFLSKFLLRWKKCLQYWGKETKVRNQFPRIKKKPHLSLSFIIHNSSSFLFYPQKRRTFIKLTGASRELQRFPENPNHQVCNV